LEHEMNVEWHLWESQFHLISSRWSTAFEGATCELYSREV